MTITLIIAGKMIAKGQLNSGRELSGEISSPHRLGVCNDELSLTNEVGQLNVPFELESWTET